jgi:hypothetical protein
MLRQKRGAQYEAPRFRPERSYFSSASTFATIFWTVSP